MNRTIRRLLWAAALLLLAAVLVFVNLSAFAAWTAAAFPSPNSGERPW